jgi:hypothetical protein
MTSGTCSRRAHRERSTIRVNNYPMTVIGIADAAFRGGIVGLATDLFVVRSLCRGHERAALFTVAPMQVIGIRSRHAPGSR